MTEHKASAEQWAELRARVEALEANAQPTPNPSQIRSSAPASSLVEPGDIFPTEYADSDGDGIRILMEPADETGQVCWVVRNSRHVNPCHEFPTPEAAYAAHKAASVTQSVAPASSLVERVGNKLPLLPDGRVDDALARAAIREVAAAARSQAGQPFTWKHVALWLEQEADRG